jgi:hypothetical protein
MANLNLRLVNSSGTIIAESQSTVDNVELVYQTALTPGTYSLEVRKPSGSGSTPYALAWHSLPAVSIAATHSTAREIDGLTGLITITRSGDTSLPLLVPLTIGGTATAGSHYQTLPNSVTIPAAQTSTALAVTPTPDFLAQGNRSVSVSIAADFALVSHPGQSAIITIEDKPFDAWRFTHFTGPELDNPSIGHPSADPDADQLPNLIEYALGLAPKSANANPLSTWELDGYLAISAIQNPAATDIIWGAEVSGNLGFWEPAVPVEDPPDGTYQARDPIPMLEAPRRFIRLKITRP